MKEAPEALAKEIFRAALAAVDPYEAVMARTGDLLACMGDEGYRRIVSVGFGKASFAMARALEDALGDSIEEGIVITGYGHAPSKLDRFRIVEAAHPVPDKSGELGTAEIVRLLEKADRDTLVVTLVSGGGSAFLVSPCEGLSLKEKQETTSLLLRAGADISELNAVRKHLSRIKGGRLAEKAFPAGIESLILSDVIGDRLDVIASGPTAPDPTTYGDALAVLDKYRLRETVPVSVLRLLERGRDGLLPETPKHGNAVFRKARNTIVGSNRIALEGAKLKAESLGLKAEVANSEISGEAKEAGRALARKALAMKEQKAEEPICLLSGGETTVVVRGKGTGGRNMELALAFALEIDGIPGITLLSAGTDGIDGPTDAAGAVVDGSTVTRARQKGVEPRKFLEDNDSYAFFRETGGLLKTGPTGTNVMDIQVVILE